MLNYFLFEEKNSTTNLAHTVRRILTDLISSLLCVYPIKTPCNTTSPKLPPTTGLSEFWTEIFPPSETTEFYIDLAFYNFILKYFVLIELKTNKITHQDIGQLDMYVRM